ncbi:MAG: hypothetical protein Q8N18_18540 [Opitutaceae bacterium]|nr:hypothetical protein [Opitutaceae bacterium]
MILILTSRDDATADFVAAKLKRSEYLRIDTDDLPSAVAIASTERRSSIRVGKTEFRPEQFSGVWYRRPKAIAFPARRGNAESRHAAAEYTAALEGFLSLIPEQRWINHPSRNILSGHKLEQVRRARETGFNVPKTLVTQDAAALRKFWKVCRGKVVLKPLSGGYLERDEPGRDTLIYTNRLREQDLARTAEIARCPTLFQERIAKEADIRITVVDGDLQAVELTATDSGEPRLDIRRNNMIDVVYHRTVLPRPIASSIHRILRSYGLRFAAIDMLRDFRGKYYFLEINPNGQWAWLDMTGATNTRDTLIRALKTR